METTTRNNALWNCKNPYQGSHIKVLCVCSAGLLRSPTIALVLSSLNFNTRAAGLYDYALIQVDDVLLEWADFIVTADDEQKVLLGTKTTKKIYSLSIPDKYEYRDPELIKIIQCKWKEVYGT